MAITFTQYDINNRTPGSFTEFDSSKAITGIGAIKRQAVLIGQKVASGSMAQDDLVLTTSQANADSFAGEGSLLSDMFRYWVANNPNTETYMVSVTDAGTAATKTVSIAGTATAAGAINLMVAGIRATTIVSNGDTNTTVATNIAAKINANDKHLFTAAAVSDTVTLTAKNQGEWTEKLDVRINYNSPSVGGTEITPAGLTVTIAAGTTGATNPSIATGLAALPDERFDYFVIPYNDDTNLDLLDTELASRQDAMQQLEGHSFNAFAGTIGAASTYGNGRNSQFSTTMYSSNNSPTPEHGWGAAYAGRASRISQNDVALPWQYEKLELVLAEPKSDRPTRSERNTLLTDGVATHLVSQSGTVQIERGITNYQLNNAGQADVSYLDSQTPLTLSYYRVTLNSWLLIKFPNYKLASDPAIISAGARIATPNSIRNEVIALAQQWFNLGLLEDLAQFKSELVVERASGDVNRVNIMLPPNLVNQLRIFANLIQFIL